MNVKDVMSKVIFLLVNMVIVKGVFNGVLEFLQGVFTGNWHMIFSGLGNIVKSILVALGGIIKAPINASINGINWVISNVNGLSFDIPSWVVEVSGQQIWNCK